MRVLFVFLLIFFTAFAAFGAPVVSGVSPNTGFTFGDTLVFVTGSGFITSSSFVTCNVPGVVCPVRVWFGDVTGAVVDVSATQIEVYAPAQSAASVDVRVEQVEGGASGTLANGFHYSATANPGPSNYTRYLVPLSGPPVEGAHGSLWINDLWLYNDADVTLHARGQFCDPTILIPCPPEAVLAAKQTAEATPWPLPDGTVTGSFIYIPKPLASRAIKHLRAYDVSRTAKSLGVEVPVVPDDEFSARVVLIDVPVDANYRASLRIYGSSEAPEQVVVRVVREHDGQLLDERTVDLAGIVTTEPAEFPFNPAYARIDPLTDAVRAQPDTVRIEIESTAVFPDEYPHPIWAFLTITNNETQEVTLISPRR